MSHLHLEYARPILVADDGEQPLKGAFFVPNNKWNLSKIAKAVYNDSSAWKVINSNQWNIDNLIYRASSTDCGSERRDSVLAKTTVSPNPSAKSAYIALCQRDARQVFAVPDRTFKYTVIWIPDLEKMPLPVKLGTPYEEPPTEPTGPSTIISKDVIKIDSIVIPAKPVIPAKSGGGSTPTKTPEQQKTEKTAGIGLVLGGLAILALLLVVPTKKNKKR